MDALSEEEYWIRLLPDLNEAQRRWLVGSKVLEIGRGGLIKIQRLTGLSAPTIIKGIKEVKSGKPLCSQERVREKGGGRKTIEENSPEVLQVLEKLIGDSTAGSPMNHLQWTHKSTRTLGIEMTQLGYETTHPTVARLLSKLGYSLQVNAKSKEGRSPVERDTQFQYINEQVTEFQQNGNPVISVDAKKKELIGNFKNHGKAYCKRGKPIEVNVYDFPSLAEGVAIPYGTYDVQRNEGFVNVGITYETAEFAVESIRRWWRMIGRHHYPHATGWLVCADGGGSNGSRNRGWKYHLQRLTTELGIPVTVCHYPPGTSKWNKIEHRMFSFISMNWQGHPLESYETVINLIGDTTTRKGLKISARLDRNKYEKGQRITDIEMEEIQLHRHSTYPKWNYSIHPRKSRES